MINIAVCDDDRFFLTQTLKYAISSAEKSSEITADIRYYTDGTMLYEDFKNGRYYDIIILDIDMPKINGKELAAKLRKIDMSFFLVFITSYSDELINTIPYRINAFISKSGDLNTYISELHRVFCEYSQLKPQRELIEIVKNNEKNFLNIPLNSIYWFRFSEKNITMKTTNGEYLLTERTFLNISEMYIPKGFFEINRNTLVNVKKISSVDSSFVLLDNGEQMEISRRKRKILLNAVAENIISEVF